MASGGNDRRRRRNSPDDDDGPGVGTALAVGAAAAGFAALIYGAKKLYDFATEETAKKMPEDDDDASYQPSQASASSSYREKPREATVPKVLEPQVQQPRANLADQLGSYYEEYVNVPHQDIQRAQQIVEQVKQKVLEYFTENHEGLRVSSLVNRGSAFEDLQVVAPDSFDLLMPVNLDQEMWRLEELSQSPTCYNIQKTGKPGSSYYNACTTGQCLSPTKVTSVLLDVFLLDFSVTTSDYRAVPVADDSTISLRVSYDEGKFLTINLEAAVCLHGIIVTASRDADICKRGVWREAFFLRENQKLRSFNPSQCCHLVCLKIIKAIAMNHPVKFGMLNSYVYKNILLLMMEDTPEEDLWRHHSLQEQFVDMLNQLVFGLQAKRIPHYFNRRVNLLEGVPPEFCEALVNFILNRIGKEKLHTLLVREYKPCGESNLA